MLTLTPTPTTSTHACFSVFSFHCGSDCKDESAYTDAIQNARLCFDHAKKVGYRFNFLDIGGGFPGRDFVGDMTIGQVNVRVWRRRMFFLIEVLVWWCGIRKKQMIFDSFALTTLEVFC